MQTAMMGLVLYEEEGAPSLPPPVFSDELMATPWMSGMFVQNQVISRNVAIEDLTALFDFSGPAISVGMGLADGSTIADGLPPPSAKLAVTDGLTNIELISILGVAQIIVVDSAALQDAAAASLLALSRTVQDGVASQDVISASLLALSRTVQDGVASQDAVAASVLALFVVVPDGVAVKDLVAALAVALTRTVPDAIAAGLQIPAIRAQLSVADGAGPTGDHVVISARLGAQDQSSLDDAMAAIGAALRVVDSQVGLDSAGVSVVAVVPESVSLFDQPAIGALLAPLLDTAGYVDSVQVGATIGVTDAASAADTAAVLSVLAVLTDRLPMSDEIQGNIDALFTVQDQMRIHDAVIETQLATIRIDIRQRKISIAKKATMQ